MVSEARLAPPGEGRSEIPETDTGAGAQLICRADSRRYAIPIGCVVEVMRMLPVQPVAGAPEYVRGLCLVRGALVPVVDVELLIGNRETSGGRLVAVKVGQRSVALQVDAVLGIRHFGAGTLEVLPPLLRDVAGETVAAIGTLDGELLMTLSVARMVPAEVFNELDRAGVAP